MGERFLEGFYFLLYCDTIVVCRTGCDWLAGATSQPRLKKPFLGANNEHHFAKLIIYLNADILSS